MRRLSGTPLIASHPLKHLSPVLLPILRQIEQKALVERSARGLEPPGFPDTPGRYWPLALRLLRRARRIASWFCGVGLIRAVIMDAWLEGSVFDESWSLLAPSVFTDRDFEAITHIWFSHEHPEHLFPPNLLRIPAEIRPRIYILFQPTITRCKLAAIWVKTTSCASALGITV